MVKILFLRACKCQWDINLLKIWVWTVRFLLVQALAGLKERRTFRFKGSGRLMNHAREYVYVVFGSSTEWSHNGRAGSLVYSGYYVNLTKMMEWIPLHHLLSDASVLVHSLSGWTRTRWAWTSASDWVTSSSWSDPYRASEVLVTLCGFKVIRTLS